MLAQRCAPGWCTIKQTGRTLDWKPPTEVGISARVNQSRPGAVSTRCIVPAGLACHYSFVLLGKAELWKQAVSLQQQPKFKEAASTQQVRLRKTAFLSPVWCDHWFLRMSLMLLVQRAVVVGRFLAFTEAWITFGAFLFLYYLQL